MGLKFLHISDIHFKSYKGQDFIDLDKDIQLEIQHDLTALKAEYGSIDGILIGGDIAFSGKQEQYDEADKWIQTICKITECPIENVFTVPGNHDVDRSKISIMVKDAQKTLKEYKGNRELIDAKIEQYLKSPADAEILNRPFENYNKFAQKYGSLPEKGNFLYWEHDFVLDGVLLTIRGMNSALVSNDEDHEENSKLVLGTHQSLMHRERGKIKMVLCHHPPSWLCDGDRAHTDFKSRARIHLFGHKHQFDAEELDSCLVLSAGAMQPERHLKNWDPRYNIIDLTIPVVLKKPSLRVKLYKRRWNKITNTFCTDEMDNGTMYQEYTIPLSDVEIEGGYKTGEKNFAMPEPVIDLTSPDRFRKLAYLFWALPYQIRIQIAVSLELYDESDTFLTELERAREYFKRAIEKQLMRSLWEKIMEYKEGSEKLPNPF